MDQDDDDLNYDLNDVTKVKTVRRVELITGEARRRNWTDEEKLSIVAESMVDGVVISDVARRHGLSPQQLYGWRSHFKAQALKLQAPSLVPAFAPAIVEEGGSAVPESRRSVPPNNSCGAIEIRMDGIEINIRGTVAQSTLITVLNALKGQS